MWLDFWIVLLIALVMFRAGMWFARLIDDSLDDWDKEEYHSALID